MGISCILSSFKGISLTQCTHLVHITSFGGVTVVVISNRVVAVVTVECWE